MDRPAVILDKGSLFAGRYLIERVVGSGGMGVVYQVMDRQTARTRALKVLSSVSWTGPRQSSLPREVLVGAAIDSPHVVDILDAGVDAFTRFPFLAMEFLRGEDLARRRSRLGRCAPLEVAIHLHQVARALVAIHRAGVVHRDLKPANIFLCRTGDTQIIKVLDFGIAKLRDGADPVTSGARAGTPAYMAPEQLRGAAVTPATDIYAFGMVAFELLVGRRYTEVGVSFPDALGSAPRATEAAIRHAWDGRASASERVAQLGIDVRLPDGFDAWFAMATAFSAGERFADAMEAAEALVRALAVSLTGTYPPLEPIAQMDRADDVVGGADADARVGADGPREHEGPGRVRQDDLPTAFVLPSTVLSMRVGVRSTDEAPGSAPHTPGGRAAARIEAIGRARWRLGLAATVVATAVALFWAARDRGLSPAAGSGHGPPTSTAQAEDVPVPPSSVAPPSADPVPTTAKVRAADGLGGSASQGRGRQRRGARRAVVLDGEDESLYTRR